MINSMIFQFVINLPVPIFYARKKTEDRFNKCLKSDVNPMQLRLVLFVFMCLHKKYVSS